MAYTVANHSCVELDANGNVCYFRLVNGLVIFLMGCLGIVFNLYVIYTIVIAKIKLPGCQNISMFNLAIINTILSVLGVFRGIGIFYPGVFVEDLVNFKANQLCVVYEIILNTFGDYNAVCLVPIAIERFIAVVLPFEHRTVCTTRHTILFVTVIWIPLLVLISAYIELYTTGYIEITYYTHYHRCISSSVGLSRDAIYFTKYILFIVLPFLTIITLYTSTLIYISRRCSSRNLTTMRLYYVTLGFAVTAVVSWFPSMTADVASLPMSYPLAQVLTVTLFYMNSVSDPVIYVLGYPAATQHFEGLCRNVCESVCGNVCRKVCSKLCKIKGCWGRDREVETTQNQPRIREIAGMSENAIFTTLPPTLTYLPPYTVSLSLTALLLTALLLGTPANFLALKYFLTSPRDTVMEQALACLSVLGGMVCLAQVPLLDTLVTECTPILERRMMFTLEDWQEILQRAIMLAGLLLSGSRALNVLFPKLKVTGDHSGVLLILYAVKLLWELESRKECMGNLTRNPMRIDFCGASNDVVVLSGWCKWLYCADAVVIPLLSLISLMIVSIRDNSIFISTNGQVVAILTPALVISGIPSMVYALAISVFEINIDVDWMDNIRILNRVSTVVMVTFNAVFLLCKIKSLHQFELRTGRGLKRIFV
ncbi:hypothetical protein ACHWQZ_G015213 [Mnemiopsis leidyi]